MLFNLIDNAAKYAAHDTEILVRARRGEKELRIEVVDEGPGIPAEDLEHIFDKFFRVHGGDRRRAGTGLGLAICRGLIDLMGGNIYAENWQDRSGARFVILFPNSLAVDRQELDKLAEEKFWNETAPAKMDGIEDR